MGIKEMLFRGLSSKKGIHERGEREDSGLFRRLAGLFDSRTFKAKTVKEEEKSQRRTETAQKHFLTTQPEQGGREGELKGGEKLQLEELKGKGSGSGPAAQGTLPPP